MDNTEFTLADTVIAGLSNPNRGLLTYKDTEKIPIQPLAKQKISETYKDMRSAVRFCLDDKLTEFAMDASMTANSSDLLQHLKLARPPHDLMWIEWDEHKRQQQMYETAKDYRIHGRKLDCPEPDFSTLPSRMGYLVNKYDNTFRQSESIDEWKLTGFFVDNLTEGSNRIIGNPKDIILTAYEAEEDGFIYLSPRSWEKTILPEMSRSNWEYIHEFQKNMAPGIETPKDLQEKLEVEHIQDSSNLLGKWWIGTHAKKEPEADKAALVDIRDDHNIREIMEHLHQIPGNSMRWWIQVEKNQKQEDWNRMAELSSELSMGDGRFLITTLAMLNYDWIIKDEVPRASTRSYKFGKFVRGNSHIRLEIDLPKFHGKTIIPKGFEKAHESSRRQHTVRGHWRRYRNGKRTWVKAHIRGDARLGIITKDYVLKHKN